MSFARMHNEYLDPDRQIHCADDSGDDLDDLLAALKDHDTGRWDWSEIDCCLTGKDADLEPFGNQGIKILHFEEDTVHCVAHVAKTFVGGEVCLNLPYGSSDDAIEVAREAYLEKAQDVICRCNMVAVEWDGDDWFASFKDEFCVKIVYTSENEPDYDATARAIIDKANEIIEPIENELIATDETLDLLAGWKEVDDDENISICESGNPGKQAAWRY